MLKISIVETILIIVLSFILIFSMGLKGVAWATVIGFLIEKILMILFLKKRYSIDFQDYTNVKIYLFYSILLVAAYFCS